MKKIILKELKEGNWLLTMGGRGRVRPIAVLYGYVERRLEAFLASQPYKETCIKVKYVDDTYNETIPSKNAKYLLYCLAILLEGFLSEKMLAGKIKKYEETI